MGYIKLLRWIKQCAIFICGLRTYFLRTNRVIGCKYFQTPTQTEPNRSPPSPNLLHIYKLCWTEKMLTYQHNWYKMYMVDF